MADLATADAAVAHVLKTEVLRPGVIQRALDIALDTLQREHRTECRVDRLRVQITRLDNELANLAETATRGGAVPVVLTALAERDAERRRVAAELAALT